MVGGRTATAAQVAQSAMRRHKRGLALHLEAKQQRVVVRGWDCRVSPMRALEVLAAASKVEAA